MHYSAAKAGVVGLVRALAVELARDGIRVNGMESTGLADPFPVLSTLKSDPVLRHHFKAANVITTLDAVNGLAQLETHDGMAIR